MGTCSANHVPCDSALSAGSTSFTLQLHGGARVTRDMAIPANAEVLLTASETGFDVTLEVNRAGQLIGRTATPVYRTGIARLALRTDSAAKISLVVAAKGDPGVRGLVVIRAFPVHAAPNDECWRVERLLAEADSHYAQAQTATQDTSSDSKTDARREYKTAADQYLTAAKQTSAPALQAYAEHASAEIRQDWLQDWSGASFWAQTAARAYRREGDPYGAARARQIKAEASLEIAIRSPTARAGGTQRTAPLLLQAQDDLRSLATFHAVRGESFDQAVALQDLGMSFSYKWSSDKAIGFFREALSIYEKLGEEGRKTLIQQNIGVADLQLGRLYDAAALYARLIPVLPGSTNPGDHAVILMNSANANLRIGHVDVALRQYVDALRLGRQVQDYIQQGRSLYGIGWVYDTLGDSDRALDFYRQSLSLMSAKLDVCGRIASLLRTAGVLRSQGQVQEALAMHDEALSLAMNDYERTSAQIQRARDLETLGQNHSALQALESVIQERNPGLEVLTAQVLLERAKVRISTGELSAAETDLRSAIATFTAEESPAEAFYAWTALAQLQHQRSSMPQALDSLDHALKLAEEVRLQSSSPELRASLLQPLRPAFDFEIELLSQAYFASAAKETSTQQHSALEALSTAEQARARAFADYERLDVGRSADQAHLLELRRSLYRELAARHLQLDATRERIANDDPRVRAIRSDISALRLKLDETETEINATVSSAQTNASNEGWILDRSRISADTAIVEYWLGAQNAVAWVATREKLTLVDLGASAKITAAARAFHDSLSTLGKFPASKRLEDGTHLYAAILQPLERYIASYRTLIFAPDGALHYIPFAALRTMGPDRSACDTSLVKDVVGEGLMGLRYVVLARGAGAVVASLWEVLDEPTSELMTAFYRSFLGEHKSVPAALSDAMRMMLSGSNVDPNRWASFTAAISAPGELLR